MPAIGNGIAVHIAPARARFILCRIAGIAMHIAREIIGVGMIGMVDVTIIVGAMIKRRELGDYPIYVGYSLLAQLNSGFGRDTGRFRPSRC